MMMVPGCEGFPAPAPGSIAQAVAGTTKRRNSMATSGGKLTMCAPLGRGPGGADSSGRVTKGFVRRIHKIGVGIGVGIAGYLLLLILLGWVASGLVARDRKSVV